MRVNRLLASPLSTRLQLISSRLNDLPLTAVCVHVERRSFDAKVARTMDSLADPDHGDVDTENMRTYIPKIK